MEQRISGPTLEALANIVTGGPGNSGSKHIGVYRSGSQLKNFFGEMGIDISVESRVPSVRECLIAIDKQPGGAAKIIQVIEQAVDPRHFLEEQDELGKVVEYLNARLKLDGYELRLRHGRHKVVSLGDVGVVTAELANRITVLDLGSVRNDFERAFEQADTYPESAITAACSMVESVCKSLLDEMSKPYPNKQDVRGLVTELAKHLNLSPSRTDLPPESENDIRQILGGLSSITSGIGALRTHTGDAHGRGKRPVRVDSRIARLAVQSACTASLFLIETWEKQCGRDRKMST